MRPRIAEVKQIVALLDAEHDSVEDLAREVLVKAWQLADERDKWCVVVNDPGVGVYVEGVFASKSEVDRAVKKGTVFCASEGATGRIVRIVNV
jgi:tRNA (Thr-GGU) A37 N-methylase